MGRLEQTKGENSAKAVQHTFGGEAHIGHDISFGIVHQPDCRGSPVRNLGRGSGRPAADVRPNILSERLTFVPVSD